MVGMEWMLPLMVMMTRNPHDGDDDEGFICVYIYIDLTLDG